MSTLRKAQPEEVRKKKLECESEKLLEKEAALLHSCCVFIDFENLKDRFESKLSKDWSTWPKGHITSLTRRVRMGHVNLHYAVFQKLI